MTHARPSQTKGQANCHPKTITTCHNGLRCPLQIFVGPIESQEKRAKGRANHPASVIFTAVCFKEEQ
jgi:hypothetical protein